MPTVIAPSVSHGKTMAPQRVAEVSKPAPLPPLFLGERLNVRVLGDSHQGQTLLQIKDSTVTAKSLLPLKGGETLTVHVEQLHPALVLRTIFAENIETARNNEFLKFYRSNPGALMEMIASLTALFREGTPNRLPHFLSGPEGQSLYKILNQLIMTDDNIADPLFLKDYVTALGLTGERRLLRALSDPSQLEEKKSGASLKEILLKFSAEGRAIPAPLGDDDPEGSPLRRFVQLSDRAATVIESLQIVNVLAQEQDGLFTLQIPVQFPGGIRMQELFIEADCGKDEQIAGRGCRIVLFLDMDALGELTADIGVRERTVHGTLKCPDREAVDFLQPLLPALGQALSEIDYKVGLLQCVLDRDIRSWKQEFLNDHSLFTVNSVDVSI